MNPSAVFDATVSTAEASKVLAMDKPAYITQQDLAWIRACSEADTHWASYFFAKVVIQYSSPKRGITIKPHLEMSEFISNSEWPRRFLLYARAHLKSTLLHAEEIRRAMKDPNIRILHGMSSERTATRVSSKFDSIFRHNNLLQLCWPDRMPESMRINWSAREKTLPRTGSHPEATFTFVGANTELASGHYDIIVADDIVAEDAAQSEAQMQKCISWFAHINPLLHDEQRSEVIGAGTRWTARDAYSVLMGDEKSEGGEGLFRGRGDKRYVFLSRGIVDEAGEPLWPAKHSKQSIAALEDGLRKTGKGDLFYLWYHNRYSDPNVKEFPEPGYWVYRNDRTEIVLMPASKKDPKVISPKDLIRTVTVDVGVKQKRHNDPSSIIMIGSHPLGHRINLYSWTHRVSPTELADRLLEIHRKMLERGTPVSAFGIENAQSQWMLAEWMIEKARKSNLPVPHIVPLKPENQAKEIRIRLFKPYVQDVYYTHASFATVNKEMALFPYGKSWQALDALAYQVQIWPAASFVKPDVPDQVADEIAKAQSDRLGGADSEWWRYNEGYGE